EKPYKCTFCSKCFGDKSACNSHIRVHTGAERCMCHICGASFSKRQKLTYHMRKHTGEGLLHCPLCTKPTTNSYALKKHIETHQQPLMKVLSNLGTTSVMEDYSEITLTALYNLAHLATQRSSELASKRKMDEQRNMPNSNEMKNQESDMSKEDIESSATAQQGCSTNHKSHKSKTEDNSQKIRKLKTEKYNKDNKRQSVDTIKSTNEKCLLNDYSKGDDDSIDINNSDCELLQEDSSIVLAEEKEKRDLTGNQKKCFVDNDNGGGHLELVKNAESTPLAPQEQTFGSLILQGTPAVVLMQLIKNIVESHFGSFQAEEVRPTLGDQLVEQCLEVMMHDDTSRSSDDGKNADTYTISSSVCNARVNADEQNISNVNYDSENAGEIVDVFKTDTWEVLGDDSCVFSTVAETLTDPLPTFTETKPSHKNTLM
ncbi:zinc finger protein 236-like, partial [Penaeus japonicus]|uniref:zinc finger protein 236-like n=1 Tax=Penaeus japonicus TaxID=27405 RepID=UPI001C71472D